MLPRLVAAAAFVVVFASPTARAAPCAGFTDVDDASPFCVNVAWMKNRGITLGCTATLYCPADFVTRLQMAAFMYRLGFQNAFLQGGNTFGAAAVLGTDDAQPVEIQANNARVMRYEPNAISPNVIGGSPANSVTAGVRGATIAGGGVPAGDTDPDFVDEAPNRVTDHYGTVGGGYANQAGDNAGPVTNSAFASVAGGVVNTASGFASTVGGGQSNTASRAGSTVGGGGGNQATGLSSTVPGGFLNAATGDYSFAAGVGANADQDQCFVFANWSFGGGSCLGRTNIARFLLDHGLSVEYEASQGNGAGTRSVYIGDLYPGQAITALPSNAYLTNTGVWTNASDRNAKHGFAPIDPLAVLDGVVNLPVTRWHYRHDGPGIEHIGPTAQDFKAAFGLGHDDKGIGTVDADGVALAAIQGLNAKLEAKVAEQTREIAELKRNHAQDIADLRRYVEKLVAAR